MLWYVLETPKKHADNSNSRNSWLLDYSIFVFSDRPKSMIQGTYQFWLGKSHFFMVTSVVHSNFEPEMVIWRFPEIGIPLKTPFLDGILFSKKQHHPFWGYLPFRKPQKNPQPPHPTRPLKVSPGTGSPRRPRNSSSSPDEEDSTSATSKCSTCWWPRLPLSEGEEKWRIFRGN